MAHRPYPNVDRALRQMERHQPAWRPDFIMDGVTGEFRLWSDEAFAEMQAGARRALERAAEVLQAVRPV